MKTIGKIQPDSLLSAQNRHGSVTRPKIPLIVLIGCFTACAAYTGEIHGTAFKEASSETVPGVEVDLYCNEKLIDSTNTGTDGTYSFQFKSAGKYQINFTRIPDQCYLSPLSDSLAADDTREWNVRVYPKNTKISSNQLADILGEHVSNNHDPAQAFNAFSNLGKAGYDNETLKEVGKKLTTKYPSVFESFTGTVQDYRNGAILLGGTNPEKVKTSDTTTFLGNSGTVIPDEKAKESLIGKKATIISDKRGTESEAKVVLFGGTGGT